MADDTTEPRSSGSSGKSGSAFTKKVVGLPVWAWMALGLGVALIIAAVKGSSAKKAQSSSATQSTSATQAAAAYGAQTPPYVIQNYMGGGMGNLVANTTTSQAAQPAHQGHGPAGGGPNWHHGAHGGSSTAVSTPQGKAPASSQPSAASLALASQIPPGVSAAEWAYETRNSATSAATWNARARALTAAGVPTPMRPVPTPPQGVNPGGPMQTS
jgi:hypothetical protein